VLAASTASAVLVAALSLPWWVRALLIALCAAQCAWSLSVRYRGAPQRVVVGIDRRVSFTDCHGAMREARVLDATYVGSCFVSLVSRADGERRSRAWLVAPDALSSEERRRLRVFLRYGRETQDDSADYASVGGPQVAPRSGNEPGCPASHAAPSMHAPLSPFV
jgi:hypothetical protein